MSTELNIKTRSELGCSFLGKGIVGHPEMGVVERVVDLIMAEQDVFGDWVDGTETNISLILTDNGFSFDSRLLVNGTYVIENYAPNFRRKNKVKAW